MNPRRVLSTALVLFVAWTASCTSILGINQDYKEADAGIPCVDPSSCDDGNACTADSCVNGLCVSTAVADGDSAAQTPGDCHVARCVGGVEESVVDTTDIASDSNDCTFDGCDPGGAPTHTAAKAGTGCSVGAETGLCDAFGKCIIECVPGQAGCDDNNPCTTDLCDPSVSQCSFTQVPDGTPTPGAQQAVGDCRVRQCIMGVDTSVVDDTDLPVSPSDCVIPACAMGVPSQSNKNAGTACSTGGGALCDGNGACVECLVDAECAGITDTCQHPACTANKCGPSYTLSDTPLPKALQVPGDCNLIVCDGSGGTKLDPDDTDVSPDGNPCTDDICSNGVLSHPPRAPNTPCGVGGGVVCDGFGKCVGCVDDTTCNPPETCAPAPCGQPNVCSCCPKSCAQQGATCGFLTDTCGGFLQCNNNLQDGAETDVDCGGGGGCLTKCGNGKKCNAPSDCSSGFCVDGVCCNNACNGVCQACTGAKKGGGGDGGCGNIKSGLDPDNECADQGQASCGTDGVCDGNGACQFYPSGSVCAPASCANANTVSKQDTCNFSHMCVDNGTQSCGNYACANGACKGICFGDADCAPTAYCSVGSCVARKANGSGCGAPNQCQSNNCVDGYCCNSICSGTCQSCGVAGSLGLCTNIPAGQVDVSPPCSGNFACDGGGSCKAKQGQACAVNGDCLNGTCVDGYCCNSACGGACLACNVAGSLGTCTNIPAGQTDNNPAGACAAPNQCNGSGTCLLGQGMGCSFSSECAPGLGCVDGICCNSACLGTCKACNVPGSLGVCANIPAMSPDYNPVCGGAGDPAHSCNGAGTCLGLPGAPCTMDNQCFNGCNMGANICN